MANQIDIRSYYSDGLYWMESNVTTSSDDGFPRDIYLWTVGDDGTLGDFQAIGHAGQLAKYQAYDSTLTNNFGIHLVKTTTASKSFTTKPALEQAIIVLKRAFDQLVNSYEEDSAIIEEIYPNA